MAEGSEATVGYHGFGLLGGLGVREDDGRGSGVKSPGSPVGSMSREPNYSESGALRVVVEDLDHVLKDIGREGGVLGVEEDEVTLRREVTKLPREIWRAAGASTD